MSAYLSQPALWLTLTLGIFFLARALQRRTGLLVLNPVLLTIALLIFILQVSGTDYTAYEGAGRLISFWLSPAVVAMGVPLYLQLERIRKQLWPILLSQLAGCLVGLVSVVLLAKALGASAQVLLSLAPKSVTTPIAIEISRVTGGIPAITAAIVVCTGVLGGTLGLLLLRLTGVRNPMSRGLAMGTASHAIGTSAALDASRKMGAFSSLGMILNGTLTAVLAPVVLRLLGLL